MCYLCPKNIKSPLLNTTFTPIICGISYFEIDRFIRSWCHLWWIYWISFEARMSRYSSHEKTICCWCDPVICDVPVTTMLMVISRHGHNYATYCPRPPGLSSNQTKFSHLTTLRQWRHLWSFWSQFQEAIFEF